MSLESATSDQFKLLGYEVVAAENPRLADS
jgi:hypothetical protein